MAITLSAFGQSNINVEQNETSDSVAQTYFQRRNPKTALVLSMLVLPGTGQMYNGDYVSGMLYAAGCISSQVLFIQGLYYINTNNKVQFLFSICGTVIGGLGMMLCWAGSWITAYQQAQTMNQEHGLLSWKVSKKNRLSISPDVKPYNYMNPTHSPISAFGLKVSIKLQ
jgi:hypothetical protein